MTRSELPGGEVVYRATGFMKRSTLVSGLLAGFFLLGSDVRGQAVDPAARGVDLFVEGPSLVARGGKVDLLVRTYGYVTTTRAKPLPAAKIEAAFSDAGATAAPVVAESDDAGIARISLTVPSVKTSAAKVTLVVSHGAHRRTRTVSLTVQEPHGLDLSLPEDSVAPGSETAAWVRLTDRVTGRAVAGSSVEVTLREGGAVYARRTVKTDASGSAIAQLPIPGGTDPRLKWTVTATTADAMAPPVELKPRTETPSTPSITASVEPPSVRAGERATFRVNVRDANGDAIADQSFRYLLLREDETEPKGTLPDGRDAFEAAATRARTDGLGRIEIPYVPPSTLFQGEQIRLVARTLLEGRERVVKSTPLAIARRGSATIEVVPEARDLVPGARQQVFLRVRDAASRPVRGRFKVEGDGLAAEVTTDEHGAAELSWDVPTDVGSRREVGPCSGSVAATVVVRRLDARDDLPESSSECVQVDREARLLVRAEPRVARAGEEVRVEVVARADGKDPPPTGPVALMVEDESGASAMTWVKAPEPAADRRGGARATVYKATLKLPEGQGGICRVSAVVPRDNAAALAGAARVLAKPAVLPKVEAKVAGGRAVPHGKVFVDVTLADEAGKGLEGAVWAMVFDRSGEERRIFEALDTRTQLCGRAGFDRAACPTILEGGRTSEVRAGLAAGAAEATLPEHDPGKTSEAEMRATFAEVMKSLEGALFESSSLADGTVDVLRKGPGGNQFNPELFQVVTAAMATPPVTPGGEPVTLADLAAVDPQVTYDNVARRVARLKLFRLLASARTFRHENDLDSDEPALSDPNALLRRWATEGMEGDLRDPWGGAFTFLPAKGRAARPFITAVPGFELVAPGPDGRAGTADDVRDPFARVLKSKTPYAEALAEDKIVDAPLDMRVAETTIAAWSSLLESSTGTRLGNRQEGMGAGSGRLGGSHRSKAPSVRMGATRVTRGEAFGVWLPPVRTDASGRARVEVPLGGDETTYRVVLIGLPNAAGPAVGSVDVPVSVPLSARIRAGDRWTVGDKVAASLRLTNRTASPVTAELTVEGHGAARLDRGEAASRKVAIPAGRSVTTSVRFDAASTGEARLVTRVKGGGHEDTIDHRVHVAPAGKPITMARARFVTAQADIPVLEASDGVALLGPVEVRVESGLAPKLDAVLSLSHVEAATSPEGLANAVDMFDRIKRHAEARGDAGARTAMRARTFEDLAAARFKAFGYYDGDPPSPYFMRVGRVSDVDQAVCPAPELGSLALYVAAAEVEPPTSAGAIVPCWDTAVSRALAQAEDAKDPVAIARLILAFGERSHRHATADDLTDRLVALVQPKSGGAIRLDASFGRDARTIVYAALAQAAQRKWADGIRPEIMIGWMEVQRGADGSYGSLVATRAAISTLLAFDDGAGERVKVRVTPLDEDRDPIGEPRDLPLTDGDGRLRLGGKEKPAFVRVEADRPVLVRLEQPALGRFRFGPPKAASDSGALTVRWPAAPKAGGADRIELVLRADRGGRRNVVVRVPLPPGVTLADEIAGVTQVPGALHVRWNIDETGASAPRVLPIRFGLAGSLTVPSAEARFEDQETPPITAPAVRLVVAP
jgi:hypothetical protein